MKKVEKEASIKILESWVSELYNFKQYQRSSFALKMELIRLMSAEIEYLKRKPLSKAFLNKLPWRCYYCEKTIQRRSVESHKAKRGTKYCKTLRTVEER